MALARQILNRFNRDERGAALVEFAIVVALLLVIVFGSVDASRYWVLRAKVTEAVREGARYGATQAIWDTVAIRKYTRGRLIGADTTKGSVAVLWKGDSTISNPNRVRVAWRTYPFSFSSALVFKSAKTISDSAEFRLEQLGQ